MRIVISKSVISESVLVLRASSEHAFATGLPITDSLITFFTGGGR